ncbi:T9SS type A sorting domain-containing protein [Aequorivita capsosiphonis]|uniref:T9SS type A sorting domain-containing protein n=1 Tax=Aequorivita capsosiphonis TaxID=487317 RepID=UPI000413DDAF|nr:T9SS type A sorting domain-containing protein [Aequorivita capsosiphonis]
MGTLQFNNTFFSKVTFTIVFLLFGIGNIQAQMGCTDSQANNYDPTATQNDGSCTYDPVNVSTTNTYPLDAILSETSGLIYWDDNLWTQNDNSDTNLYALNPSDGAILNSISLDPEINKDWEEISQDEDYVYVGDFGNNVNGNRTDLRILRVSKSSIVAGTPQIDIINFAYEDQIDFTPTGANNTDYDCEAFIIADEAIFLFTKQWVSNETRIYKLPKTPGTYQAALQDTYAINGLVTGAVYKKNEQLIALSGYSNFLQPFVFLLYDYTEEDFFGANKRKLEINLPFHQVEGITTDDGLNYFITNEKYTATGTTQQLHTLNLTEYLEEYLNVIAFEESDQFKIFPNPATSIIEIRSNMSSFPITYTIVDSAAKKVKEGTLNGQNSSIDISELSVGNYIFQLGKETINSFRVIKR